MRPKPALVLLILAALALTVVGYAWWALGVANGNWPTFSAPIVYRVGVVVVLMLFVPFTAVSFYVVRRDVRRRQLRVDCLSLCLDYEHYYHIYNRVTLQIHFLYYIVISHFLSPFINSLLFFL